MAVLLLSIISGISQAATEGESQANSFSNIYAAFCLKYLNNFEELRAKLKLIHPQLPHDKAMYFLEKKLGDAWSVSDKNGAFVVVLPSEEQSCLVYGEKTDAELVKRKFIDFFTMLLAPLNAVQIKSEQVKTAGNTVKKTISYEWSAPNKKQTILFSLTTASSETAQIQILGLTVR